MILPHVALHFKKENDATSHVYAEPNYIWIISVEDEGAEGSASKTGGCLGKYSGPHGCEL